jgi:hypothetical protein
VAAVGWWAGRHFALHPVVEQRAAWVLGGAVAMFVVGTGLIYARIFIPQGGRYLWAVGAPLTISLACGLRAVHIVIARALGRTQAPLAYGWVTVLLAAGLNWVVLWRGICQWYGVRIFGT